MNYEDNCENECQCEGCQKDFLSEAYLDKHESDMDALVKAHGTLQGIKLFTEAYNEKLKELSSLPFSDEAQTLMEEYRKKILNKETREFDYFTDLINEAYKEKHEEELDALVKQHGEEVGIDLFTDKHWEKLHELQTRPLSDEAKELAIDHHKKMVTEGIMRSVIN